MRTLCHRYLATFLVLMDKLTYTDYEDILIKLLLPSVELSVLHAI